LLQRVRHPRVRSSRRRPRSAGASRPECGVWRCSRSWCPALRSVDPQGVSGRGYRQLPSLGSDTMSTWFITGTSARLGRCLPIAALEAGHNVVATARNVSTVADLVERAPDRVLATPLDVTAPDQIAAAVQQATARFGGVDVLVNNAGYGYRSAVEEGDDADVRTLFETHFFGTVAMIKAVLPGMRARRSRAIVSISSIVAQLTPVGSGYFAAAHARIDGLSR